MSSFKHLITSFYFLVSIIIFGTIGYYNIEKWSLIDSFYMTIITLSTVGYGELHSLSLSGRIFTSGLIIISITFMAYFTANMARTFIEGEILMLLGKRKLEKKLKTIKDHYIVCGYGRIGKVICQDLHLEKKPFLIIESDSNVVENQIIPEGYLHILGDSTQDETLVAAGIQRAKGIVTAVDSDASNVFITLMARELNPNIFILSRASNEMAEKKLKRAGASKVVLPYTLGGKRMVSALLRPYVTNFLEMTTGFQSDSLQILELQVEGSTPFINQSLREANLRSKFGVIIIAIRKHDGSMKFNPGPEEILQLSDILIILGYQRELERMGKVF